MGYERTATVVREPEQTHAARVRRESTIARRPAPTALTLPDFGAAPSGLHVGAANDVAERDADRIADQVLRRLDAGEGALAPDTGGRVRRNPSVPAAARQSGGGRVRRTTAPSVGLEGGMLDEANSGAIQRARRGGAPLDGGVRRRMESGFGADFGGVRLHTGPEATRLNESMQAQAFTIGSDVFLHDSAPRPGAAGGDHLLAHELAHTLQQSPGASRRAVHRKMMDSATFMQSTKEGLLTGTSTAQKTISKMLDEYNQKYPVEKHIELTKTETKDALNMLAMMRDVAQGWMSKHTVTELGGEQLKEEIKDASRMKRRAGMEGFLASCRAEMVALKKLDDARTKSKRGTPPDVDSLQVTKPSEEFSKVKSHYEKQDLQSVFRGIGGIIESVVPLDGDQAKLEISANVPVHPPAYVGMEFGVQVQRDGEHIELGLNLGVTGGVSVDVAKFGAALGGFIKAKAKTGADVGELLSYGLYRRSRQSNLIPREVENLFWGGQGGEFGWAQAEAWSLGVEERIFGSDGESEVTTGAYGKAKAEAKLSDIAQIGAEVKGTVGTKINQDSLQKRKGGAGKRNLKSGSAPDSGNFDEANSRGAQKSVGVGVGGLEIQVGGKLGPFEAALKSEFGWTSDGAHGKKTVAFDAAKVGGELAFTMPMGNVLAGGIGNVVPKLIEILNRVIRTSCASAEGKGKMTPGATLLEAGNYTGMVAELATLGNEAWKPFAKPPDDVAGTSSTNELKFSFGVDFDLAKGELSLSLNQAKSLGMATKALDSAGQVSDVLQIKLERTSRLLKLTRTKDSKWTVS